MGVGTTRKGVTQAKFNEDAANFIFFEITLISGVVGYFLSNWYIFGGMLVGLICLMVIPLINIILAIVLSVVWSIIGAGLACFFQDVAFYLPQHPTVLPDVLETLIVLFSIPAAQITGGIMFLSALGLHLGAIEWVRDVGDTEDRNL